MNTTAKDRKDLMASRLLAAGQVKSGENPRATARRRAKNRIAAKSRRINRSR